MKCPECVKSGLRSRVYIGLSSTTLLNWTPFYDEDGQLRNVRNPNTTTTDYTCSQGHSWSEQAGGEGDE